MKSAILTLALVFMASAAFAQTANRAESSNENLSPANVQTIRGCLTKTGNTYTLLGNNPVRQYRIIGGNIAALKGKLEHTVAITGPVGEVKSGASTNGKYNPTSTTGVGYDTIRAQSVKEVAANCG